MIKDRSLASPIAAPKADPLEGLDDAALLALRSRIDKQLRVDLAKLDLADELGVQYRSGMTLLATVRDDPDVPANQKSQVFNTVSAMLEKIVKQQKVVFNAERLKRFESAFLRVLDEMPAESKRKFFDMYADYLTGEKKLEEAA